MRQCSQPGVREVGFISGVFETRIYALGYGSRRYLMSGTNEVVAAAKSENDSAGDSAMRDQ